MSKYVVQSWRETSTYNVKVGDIIFVPEINEWHKVGHIVITGPESADVWYNDSSHPASITRMTTKVAL